jgi:hypothetical protein
VYLGGAFSTIGKKNRDCFVAFDVKTGLATNWDTKADYGLTALTICDSTLYVGGHFNSVSGQNRSCFAALGIGR